MGKNLANSILKMLFVGSVGMAVAAHAEDIYIDCTGNNASSEQCAALYSQQNYLTPNGQGTLNAGQEEMIDTDSFDAIIDATPELKNNPDQIVLRDTAAPIAVSRPINELEEEGSEYSVYKTPNGSMIIERDVSHEATENGGVIQRSRTKSTEISPSYVEMPSISAAKRKRLVAYGDSVHDWEAMTGESLRTLLVDWGSKSGWTVVWKLDRDYILEAGVVFRGTFTEVASAIIRTFARANPAPIGTFYKGNRVLVINTQEDDNA